MTTCTIPRVVVVGAGQMGSSILRGLSKSRSSELIVVDNVPERHAPFRALRLACFLELPALQPTDVVVLAIPPQELQRFVAAAPQLQRHRGPVISVMAGVRLETLARVLDTVELVRSIPNTPSEVHRGMTVFVAAEAASPETVGLARAIFDRFGDSVRVAHESMIDTSTALCGGGPAFVAFFAQALQEFARRSGFDEAASFRITVQVLLGTAELMAATQKPAEQICREVMTPQGTTERGIRHFEAAGLREIVCAALEHSAARSTELGHLLHHGGQS